MRRTIQKSIRTLVVFTFLTGIAYPLVVTVVAQLIAPDAANGSIIFVDGRPIGSALLGQKFSRPEYFWGRPSAVDYGTLPGGASNLGPTSQKLKDRVAASLKEMNIDPNLQDKPYDLILASGSGLDPHITPESARFQMERIAKVRVLSIEQLNALIDKSIEDSSLGLIGRPRINVLKLNLALDRLTR